MADELDSINLPRFAEPMLCGRVRCSRCDTQIGSEHVSAAGVRRNGVGRMCFAFECRCPRCNHTSHVSFADFVMTRPDWWNQIAEMHEAARPVQLIAANAQTARRNLPKIGPILVGSYPLESFWIRGAYRGDVGPIYFIYEGTERHPDHGLMRLEPGQQVSFHHHADPQCLPRLDLGWFAAVPDGGTFPFDQMTWIKMSPAEIEDIIRDRVFQIVPDSTVLITTPTKKTRSSHGTSNDSPGGGKKARRPSRDSGKVDLRRRRP